MTMDPSEMTLFAGGLLTFAGIAGIGLILLFKKPTRDHRGTRTLSMQEVFLILSLIAVAIGVLILLLSYAYSTSRGYT
ncbi:MAG: hypothetical protein KBC33_00115 [Candidatus Pacebacteria bacterium]|nr:hypothetical protein [Candidatus Paceibacterota bacterium]